VPTVTKVRSIESSKESHRQKERREFIFSCGDCLFLILVGAAASLVMYIVHGLMTNLVYGRVWHAVLSLVIGMSFVAIVQTLLAFSVAPVLGSIESIVPSIVVAMILPMLICGLVLVGIDMSRSGVLGLGVAGGISTFLLLKAYGGRCRKSLSCAFPQKAG